MSCMCLCSIFGLYNGPMFCTYKWQFEFCASDSIRLSEGVYAMREILCMILVARRTSEEHNKSRSRYYYLQGWWPFVKFHANVLEFWQIWFFSALFSYLVNYRSQLCLIVELPRIFMNILSPCLFFSTNYLLYLNL